MSNAGNSAVLNGKRLKDGMIKSTKTRIGDLVIAFVCLLLMLLCLLPMLHVLASSLSSADSLVKNEVYRSNWELSAARSISVIEDMAVNGIDPHRLGVEAYGQFAPFVSNSTERGRARNRCVTVAISKYAMRPAKLEVLPDLVDTSPGAREQLSPRDLEDLEIIRMPDGRIKVFSRQEPDGAADSGGKSSGRGTGPGAGDNK